MHLDCITQDTRAILDAPRQENFKWGEGSLTEIKTHKTKSPLAMFKKTSDGTCYKGPRAKIAQISSVKKYVLQNP